MSLETPTMKDMGKQLFIMLAGGIGLLVAGYFLARLAGIDLGCGGA